MRRCLLSAARLHRLLTSSLIAAVLLLSMAPVLGQAPAAQAQTSPAGDNAQVIAQGIAELPAAEVSWQALAFSAGPLDATGTINADGQSLQSPGFLLATGGPFLTVDADGELQHRLNPGEAAFTPGEARLNPLSETTDLVRYVALNLAATSGPKSSTGIPFYAGESFTVEPSVRDFDLVRSLLDPGQSTQLTSGEIPALFLTLEGQLELATPAGDSAVLETEQAITYAGEISITNVGSSRATFVSAIVGDEITVATGGTSTASRTPPAPRRIIMPAAPRRTTTAPAGDRGTITLRAYTCPPGTASGAFDPSACAPLTTGFEAQLNKVVDGSVLRLSQAARDGNAFRWEGLTINPDDAQNLMVYIPSQPVTPAGFSDFDITGDISNVGTIALMASKPNAEIAIYNFAAAAESNGSFMIDVSTCPVPVDPAAPNLGECGAYNPPGSAAAALDMSLSSGSSVLYPDSSQANIATWANLPPGTYTLNQNAASEGFHSVRIGGQTLVCCQAGALSVTIDTSQGDVSRTLFLYFETDSATTGPGPAPATLDTDGDGLSDEEEVRRGIDPNSADTDGDGLTDAEELNGQTSAIAADSDFDGVTDGDEVAQGTDPIDAGDPGPRALTGGLDTDGDRLGDEREARIGSNPQSVDTDGDGLTDYEEVDIYQSNPVLADMDGDGIDDGDEVNQGTNPFDPNDPGDPAADLDADGDGFADAEEIAAGTDPNDPVSNLAGPDPSSADADADGVSDEQEGELGTDPFNADSDFDGMSDGNELQLGFAPLVPDQGEIEPELDQMTVDSDGDGVPDGAEIDAGTDPFTPD